MVVTQLAAELNHNCDVIQKAF